MFGVPKYKYSIQFYYMGLFEDFSFHFMVPRKFREKLGLTTKANQTWGARQKIKRFMVPLFWRITLCPTFYYAKDTVKIWSWASKYLTPTLSGFEIFKIIQNWSVFRLFSNIFHHLIFFLKNVNNNFRNFTRKFVITIFVEILFLLWTKLSFQE